MEHAAGRTAAGKDMTAAEQAELKSLQWDWGDAYDIGHDDEHSWHAKRRDGHGGLLTAADPDELYKVIAADYGDRHVARDYTAPLDDS